MSGLERREFRESIEKEPTDTGMSGGSGENNVRLTSRDCSWFLARLGLILPTPGAWGDRLAGLRGTTGWNAEAALCVQFS